MERCLGVFESVSIPRESNAARIRFDENLIKKININVILTVQSSGVHAMSCHSPLV